MPALALSLKSVTPPEAPLTEEPLLTIMVLAAVAELVNSRVAEFADVTKFWVTPELLMIPAPLRSRVVFGEMVIVYGEVAFSVKVIVPTSVLAESEGLSTLERSKTAAAPEPLGTAAGFQLAAVFQSDEPGLGSQV